MGFKSAEIKGLDKVQKDFQAFLDASKKNPVILNDVGETAVKYIRGSVRARRDDYKVDDVGEGWANRRARLATVNETANTYVGSKTTITIQRVVGNGGSDTLIKSTQTTNHKNQIKKNPNAKSNLTFSGQLLDSMSFKIDTAVKRVTIYFKGTHKPYTGITGGPVDEPKTNAAIASKLNADPRFHFLFISKKLELILKDKIIAGMRRQLSNYRKVKRLLSK